MADRKQKRTKWAEVSCDIHGKEMAGNTWKGKQVRVSIPTSKRDKMAGCPQCSKDKLNASKS